MGFLGQKENATSWDGQLWEYKARNLGKVAGSVLETDFNKFGLQGWELVGMVSGGREGYAIFKRPLERSSS